MYFGANNKSEDVPDLDVFNSDILQDVQTMALNGMSETEILEGFSITNEEFEAFGKNDKIYFKQFFNYGRAAGLKLVGGHLIEQSKGKGGINASMAYLRRFAENFKGEIAGESGAEFNFSFVTEKDA